MNTRRISFLIAAAALIGAAFTPGLRALGEASFAVHMARHIVFVLVIPALIVPVLAARTPRLPPWLGWAAGIGAMAFWHVPVVFLTLMWFPAVRAVEPATLVAAGVLFWLPVLSPNVNARLATVPWGIAYLFTACLACTAMGIMIAFAPAGTFTAPGNIADQQAGGLVMWVPCCFVYLTVILIQLARWFSAPDTIEQKI